MRLRDHGESTSVIGTPEDVPVGEGREVGGGDGVRAESGGVSGGAERAGEGGGGRGGSGGGVVGGSRVGRLNRELGGDLPCVVCGYNLRGLSVLGGCPECGTNIRATVLAVVDPSAEELRPMLHPRFTAVGLVLIVFGGLVAGFGLWYPRLIELLVATGVVGGGLALGVGWRAAVYVGLVLSFVGVLGLVRLHEGEGFWRRGKVLLGSLLLAGFGVAVHAMIRRDLAGGGPVYLGDAGGVWSGGAGGGVAGGGVAVDAGRVMLRLLAGALLIGVILLVRSNIRALVARSMVLRSGRVDRQTLYAMAAAVFVGMVGDAIRLVSSGILDGGGVGGVRSGFWLWLGVAGTMVVFVGSALLTIGLMGSLLDAVRIARVVVKPGPSLTQLLGAADVDNGAGAEAGGRG